MKVLSLECLSLKKKAKSGDADSKELNPILHGVHELLKVGKPARLLKVSEVDKPKLKSL